MNIGPKIQLVFLCLGIIFHKSINYFDIQNSSEDKIPSFPGAEGAGKYTSGGRGGEVIEVINLNDNGYGSLRYAIKSSGSRIIVFRISGTIELEKELVITKGNLSIMGQTAPGDGICVKGYPLLIDADNVIIRYIRIRLGDIAGRPFDAINCKNRENIIIDHCSFSWSVDECASFYDNKNFTLQWSIISESLNNSFHPKGSHGYGGIWGGIQATFHHNIIAHHTSRLPRFQGSRYHKHPAKEKAEFCNNVIYNWRDKCSYGGEKGNYNIVGNLYIPGPATPESKIHKIVEPYKPYGKFYFKDNYIFIDDTFKQYKWHNYFPDIKDINVILTNTPANIIYPAICKDPLDAYYEVLEYSGASLVRDNIDKRIVDEVENGIFHYGNKGIIDTQRQFGGWPDLRSLEAPADNDHDGMPDDWENNNNLNPRDYSDRNNYNLSKDFTNIEHYLNKLAGKFN